MQSLSSNLESYDILESKLNGSNQPVYTNPADQRNGEFIANVDSNGNSISGTTTVNLNNSTTIRGIAYFDSDNDPFNGIDGGMAVIQGPGIQVHNPLEYQQNIVDVGNPVPTPTSAALMTVAGGIALLRRTSRDKNYQNKE